MNVYLYHRKFTAANFFIIAANSKEAAYNALCLQTNKAIDYDEADFSCLKHVISDTNTPCILHGFGIYMGDDNPQSQEINIYANKGNDESVTAVVAARSKEEAHGLLIANDNTAKDSYSINDWIQLQDIQSTIEKPCILLY